jgi:ABC-2 type transport system permease protein
MKKYWQIFKTSWQNALVYRFNFVIWRLRTIVYFLAVYWFWAAVFRHNRQVVDYTQAQLLTYVLAVRLADTLVFSNLSYTTAAEIANGDLNNYLLKPLGYLKNWLARDLADKVLNLIFFGGEMLVLYWLLRPPLLLPASAGVWLAFGLTLFLAAGLYFFFSFIVSAFTFWYPEHNGWPLRFILLTLLEFLTGAFFPLDLLPASIYAWFKWLPFGYLIYFPAGFYLNKFAVAESVRIWLTMAFWLAVFYWLAHLIWRRGLKIYGAYGR